MGGSGKGHALAFPVAIHDQNGAFTMTTRLELEPGASVGYHLHADNEEVYFIMSGEWLYTEENETQHVKAGDIMLCRMGRSHGIENSGKETLVVGAAIAKRG
ncbi:MAG: cupin domain-containing protein [Synergistaceae bacterium]|nr:cupin domain-containing protein [Synergistaceae bacterium]